MFFNLVLLGEQHKATFGYAWVAATRGVQHINKKQLLAVRVDKLCDKIQEYVCSQSDSPRKRFSLRLSATLVNGTLKIFRQQSVYLLEDLIRALSHVSKPVQIHYTLGLDLTGNSTHILFTPPTPVIKIKGKKRKRGETEQSTPQSEIDRIILSAGKAIEGIEPLVHPEQAVLQARGDEVTLRESLLQQQTPQEFGIFGTVTDDFLNEIANLDEQKAVLPRETPLSQEARRDPTMSSPEVENAPVRITVEAQVHTLAGFETPPEERSVATVAAAAAPVLAIPAPDQIDFDAIAIIQAEPDQIQRPAQVEKPRRARSVLKELQSDVVNETAEPLSLRRKSKDNGLRKNCISNRAPKTLRIDRHKADEIEHIDINPCKMPQFKLKCPNLTHLLDMYILRDDNTQMRQRPSDGGSLERSADLQRKSGHITPPVQVSAEQTLLRQIEEQQVIPEVPVQIIVSAPEQEMIRVETPQIPIGIGMEIDYPLTASTPKGPRLDTEQRTIEEIMAAAAQIEGETPCKRRRLIDVEPQISKDLAFLTLPSELISRELTEMIPQESLDSVPLPLLNVQSRQQHIVNQIFANEKMTLQEICQRPVNKLNIARAFSDVLVLTKHNYVVLLLEDHSSQLAFIEKGPKMMS